MVSSKEKNKEKEKDMFVELVIINFLLMFAGAITGSFAITSGELPYIDSSLLLLLSFLIPTILGLLIWEVFSYYNLA